jgi:chemotaxis protein MotB
VKTYAPAGRAGSDRWLVSYADLMTLLFACSVTLFAARVEDVRRPTPGLTAPPAVPVAAADTVTRRETPVDLDASLERRLTRELTDAIGARRLEVIRDTRGLVVSMPDDAAFSTGSAEATAQARQLIRRIGDTLRDVPNTIRIEGHTDDVPIRTVKYESNWELSTARASAVVAFLIDSVGLDASRLSAAGYGQFHPLNPNDSDAHRARNRRVDVVVLDVPAAATQPAAPQNGASRAAP